MATTARVAEYSLIEADTADELVETVNTALRDGWQPYGGISGWYLPVSAATLLQRKCTHYMQALVKYGEV